MRFFLENDQNADDHAIIRDEVSFIQDRVASAHADNGADHAAGSRASIADRKRKHSWIHVVPAKIAKDNAALYPGHSAVIRDDVQLIQDNLAAASAEPASGTGQNEQHVSGNPVRENRAGNSERGLFNGYILDINNNNLDINNNIDVSGNIAGPLSSDSEEEYRDLANTVRRYSVDSNVSIMPVDEDEMSAGMARGRRTDSLNNLFETEQPSNMMHDDPALSQPVSVAEVHSASEATTIVTPTQILHEQDGILTVSVNGAASSHPVPATSQPVPTDNNGSLTQYLFQKARDLMAAVSGAKSSTQEEVVLPDILPTDDTGGAPEVQMDTVQPDVRVADMTASGAGNETVQAQSDPQNADLVQMQQADDAVPVAQARPSQKTLSKQQVAAVPQQSDADVQAAAQLQGQNETTVQQGVSADTGQQAGAAEENAPQAVAQAEAQAIAPQAARDNAQPADQAAADQAAADQAAADVETVAAAYQPGVPVYAAYGQIVRLATSLPTMQERIGKRYWAGQGAAQIEEGDGEEARLSWKGNDILTDLGLVWGQAEAGHRHAALAGSDLHTRYTANDWKVTLGLDNQLHEANDNRLLGGVWVRYSRINADIASALGKGAIETQAYGVGGALTWLSDNGLYVDAQAQYSRLKGELSPDKVSKALASNAKAESYDVSLEAGKSVRLNDYWTLTPQVQLSWNHVTANSFTDADANTVRFELKDQVTLRGGVAVEYAKSWQDKGGKTVRASVHGIANLRHRLAGKGSRLQLADQSVKIGHEERTWGEIGLGGRYELKDRRLAVFGDVTAGTAMNNPGKNHYVAGKLGLSIKW